MEELGNLKNGRARADYRGEIRDGMGWEEGKADFERGVVLDG